MSHNLTPQHQKPETRNRNSKRCHVTGRPRRRWPDQDLLAGDPFFVFLVVVPGIVVFSEIGVWVPFASVAMYCY